MDPHFQLIQLLIFLMLRNISLYTIVALARIFAAKPRSMDVERLISSYNFIKSTDCSSLTGETLQGYLTVWHNMPSIANFNVRQAVEEWMSMPKET